MKIVTRNADSAVVMVADASADGFDPALYTIRDLPGWDWSLADLTGVDRSLPDLLAQLMWNGTTLVKKP